ncbi:MAG: PH domain-containing protein [Candidatus Thermoplasmatota archaeon]|nr:PH domain-containing protein [Candidatus Thermoplasmatota archaeon]
MSNVDRYPFDDRTRYIVEHGVASPKWRLAIGVTTQFLMQFMLLICIITIPLMPIAAIAIYFWSHAYVKKYHFQFTDERIIVKRGVFSKRVVNIPYDRIQNVVISQTFIERIAGVYTVNIETAGTAVRQSNFAIGSDASIQGLEDPEPIKDFIHWMVKRTNEGIVEDGVSFSSSKTRKDKTEIAMLRELQSISASLQSIETILRIQDPMIDDKKIDRSRVISVQCPYCSHTFTAALGTTTKCPNCGKPGVVEY